MLVGADVKCYHCGHISGRIEGDHRAPLTARTFQPRPGYGGKAPRPGQRLLCERCGGPVYLEDLRPVVSYRVAPAAPRRRSRRRPAGARRAA